VPLIYSAYTNNLAHSVSRFMIGKTNVVAEIPKIVWGIETSKDECPRVMLNRVEEPLCWNVFSKYDCTNAAVNRAFINVQCSEYLTGQIGRA
jgi:hypothetical protein